MKRLTKIFDYGCLIVAYSAMCILQVTASNLRISTTVDPTVGGIKLLELGRQG